MQKLAQTSTNITNPAIGTLGTLNAVQFFGGLFPALMGALLVIGIVYFLFHLIMGAINWIGSGGDKGKLQMAKDRVTNAVVGLIILLSFFAILGLTECFFGIGLRQITVGPFNVSLAGTPVCP